MIDYKTKTDPQKVLFYNIDQLAWPCSLYQQKSTSMTDHTPAACLLPIGH